jgi:hypothetical protein
MVFSRLPHRSAAAADVDETGFWSSQFSPAQWNLILSGDCAELRRATRLGRPWADSEFVREVEQSTGTRLTARPPGRPQMSEVLRKRSGSSDLISLRHLFCRPLPKLSHIARERHSSCEASRVLPIHRQWSSFNAVVLDVVQIERSATFE